MSSPFTTIEAFNDAINGPTEGAIYTFAQSPVINAIALIASAGLFIWFIVSTYSGHDSKSSSVDKSLEHLSTFFIVGFLSLMAAEYRQRPQATLTAKAIDAEQSIQYSQQQSTQQQFAQQRVSPPERLSAKATRQQSIAPLGLLGMLGIGANPLRQLGKRGRRKKRSPRGYSRRL
ncbi:MAG: hypothetical protein ACFB16_01990 [Phormidesmis sp.]